MNRAPVSAEATVEVVIPIAPTPTSKQKRIDIFFIRLSVWFDIIA